MASMFSVPAALAAALLLGGAAAAVELKGLTGRVNPDDGRPGAISNPFVVKDAKGGFGVFWSRDVDQSQPPPDQLFARFYSKDMKPGGRAKRFDQPIDGDTPFYTQLAGAVRLGGHTLAVWGAQFPSTTTNRPVDVVGRAFEKRRPFGAAKVVDFDDVNAIAREPVLLSDGRALVTWMRDFSQEKTAGRFIKADGSVSPTKIDLSRADAVFQTVVALSSGFLATYSEFSADFTQQRLFAQLYDDKGGRVGKEFPLVPLLPRVEVDTSVVVGLASGEFVALRMRPTSFGVAELLAQRFSRVGQGIGQPVTLAKDKTAQAVLATALPGGGFLVAMREPETAGERIAFTRYNGGLGQVGPSARTDPISGLFLSSLTTLANGWAATAYLANGGEAFVQTMEY